MSGVLFFGIDINLPSVLWMRRMLEGLGDDARTLAVEYPLVEKFHHYRERYQVLELDVGSGSFWRRARRKLLRQERIPIPGATLRRLSRAVEAPEISAVLVHYANLATRYDAVWRRTKKPVFVHCHGYDVTWDLRVVGEPDRLEHPTGYVDKVRALSPSVRFIANSESTARRLLEIGIAEERVTVKHLGVEVPDEPPSERSMEGPLEILYLGRLIDCKGPDLVIQAFERAVDRGLDGHLHMAGDGPLWGACEALRDASPHRERIELHGAVDAKKGEELRRRAHLFTAHNQLGPDSHQEEAFGVSIVEAMGVGLPVISGRSGSLPELVENGEQGVLVEPGDVEAHAEAFLRLGGDADLRLRMGTSGWRRVRERYTFESEMKILRGLLGLGASGEKP